MKLSDVDIKKAIEAGSIAIDPAPPEEHFGSFSVDLTLSNEFRAFEHSQHPFIDLASPHSVYAMSEKLMRDIQAAPGPVASS
ncbi:MAG: dCTP deaminase domain-containing protein, partial [Gammaproteobacteria bacterium]